MAFNTGNPLGSSDFKDLSDNAVNFDKYSNGPDPAYQNRFGEVKLSISGMNEEFANAQDGREAAFEQFLADSAFVFIGDYGAGLNFTSRTQYMIRDGVPYRIAPSTTLPYTTTGNWGTEAVNFSPVSSDDILRQQLGEPDGADLVAWGQSTLGKRASNAVFVEDHGAIGDGVTDSTAAIMAAHAAAVAAGAPLCFGPGTFAHTGLELGGVSNFTLIAVGRVILKNTAAGPALSISGGATNRYNYRVFGDFVVKGNALSTDGVFMRRVHHSIINFDVKDVPGKAFNLEYAVCSKFRLKTSLNTDGGFVITPAAGLYINQANAGEFTSACEFDLIIEGPSGTGLELVQAQQCTFTGTSEHCGGVGVKTGVNSKYNNFVNFDIEQNGAGDIDASGICDTWENITCRSVSRTNNVELIAAKQNHFIGGDLRSVNEQAGCIRNRFENSRTSSNGALGIKLLTGSNSNIVNCPRYDVSGNIVAWYLDRLGAKGSVSVVAKGTTGAGTGTGQTGTLWYEVIGAMVYCQLALIFTAKEGALAGNVLIDGLPFISDSTAGRITTFPIGRFGNLTTPTAGYVHVVGQIAPGATSITLLATGYSQAVLSLPIASITNTTEIYASFAYPLPAQL